MQSHPHKSYLPHIDGMRAISVLAVILFHFELLGVTGGFIGVDVFFTISGFLIIGSITALADRGEFKAGAFWGRRIRRLFPAILATLALSLLAGLLLFSPGDLAQLARDSVYALFSVINFTLLQTADYFDLEGFDQPLLHFWSLAVEEQFYLVFPLIAMAGLAVAGFRRNYRRNMMILLVGLSVLSLIASQVLIASGQSLVAYYMMPSRFFQLALGGVLAIALQSEALRARREAQPRSLHDLLVVAGIAAIIGLSFAFTRTTAFPGINALWPTLAALALLYSGGVSRLSPLLENPVASHLGRLSYSLYLVHWPVWTFACYYLDRALTPSEALIAMGATYLISLAIYTFVEKPVRFSPRFAGRRLFAAVLPATALSVAAFVATFGSGGLPQRIDPDRRAFAMDAGEFHKTEFGGIDYPTLERAELGHPAATPDFLLIGNSKALQYALGVDETLYELDRSAVMVVQNGCYMMIDAGRIIEGAPPKGCPTTRQTAMDAAADLRVDVVSVRGWGNLNSNPRHQIFEYTDPPRRLTLREIADEHIEFHEAILDSIGPERRLVIVTDQKFRTEVPIAACLARPTYLPLRCLRASESDASLHTLTDVEQMLADWAATKPNVDVVKAADIFCATGVCSQVGRDGTILFSDSGHVSKAGSRLYAPRLLELAGLDGRGAELGDPRTTTDIEDAIRAAWRAGDMAAFRQNIVDYGIYLEDRKQMHDFMDALWNGRVYRDFEKDRAMAVPIALHMADVIEESFTTYVAGFINFYGVEQDKNMAEALRYWTHPTQKYNETVQYRLAKFIYLDESSEFHDPEEGLRRLRAAAQGGQADAIAELTARGESIPQSEPATP